MKPFYQYGRDVALTKLALMPSQIQHGLMGAGIGGVVGAGVGAFAGDSENRRRNMMRGALGGVALGGTAGLLAQPTFGDHVMSQPRQLMGANPVTHSPTVQPNREFTGRYIPQTRTEQVKSWFTDPNLTRGHDNTRDMFWKGHGLVDQQSLHVPTSSDSMSYNPNGA
jgi:hypothetical protein